MNIMEWGVSKHKDLLLHSQKKDTQQKLSLKLSFRK